MDEVVWLKEDRGFAFLIKRNAFYSTVLYLGEEIEVENDDYEYWSERSIDYESD
jgi:hypothetical protein